MPRSGILVFSLCFPLNFLSILYARRSIDVGFLRAPKNASLSHSPARARIYIAPEGVIPPFFAPMRARAALAPMPPT